MLVFWYIIIIIIIVCYTDVEGERNLEEKIRKKDRWIWWKEGVRVLKQRIYSTGKIEDWRDWNCESLFLEKNNKWTTFRHSHMHKFSERETLLLSTFYLNILHFSSLLNFFFFYSNKYNPNFF